MKTLPGLLFAFLFSGLLCNSGFCQTINLHSISVARQTSGQSGYTLDGNWMLTSSRPKIQNQANFGPLGTYNKNVFVIDGYATSGSLTQMSTVPLSDLFLFGTFDLLAPTLQPFTTAEIDSLYNWSKRGGKLIIAPQAKIPGFDPTVLHAKWGFDIALDVPASITPTVTGNSTSIFHGPFGTVSSATQGGSSEGYFSATPQNFVTLATTGLNSPTLIVDCNTLDLIIADIDAYTSIGGVSAGPSIVNQQDILWANTIVFMDQMEGPPVITRNGLTLGTGNYIAYQWYLDGVAINGATSQTLNVDSNGTYMVKVTLSCTCEVISDPVVIADYQTSYHANATQTNADCGLCTGTASAYAIYGTAPYSYLWSTGETTTGIGPVCAGVYSVTVTDMNLNSATASVIIENDTVPVAAIQATSQVICAGDSSLLCTGIGFSNYLWNNGETNACMYVKDAGNYYLTVTDNNGCTAESNHVSISVNPPPPVTISVNGDTLMAYGAVGYQWYLNDNPIAGANSPFCLMLLPGSYTVAVTDINGCSSFSSPVAYSGIYGTTADAFFIVYPYPVTDKLMVELQEPNFELTIYDLTGQKIFARRSITGKTEVNCSSLSPGVYFVTAQTDRSVFTRKFLKQ